MKLTVRTVLDAPAQRVWDEARRPRLLHHVAAPMLIFEPLTPATLPEFWAGGQYLVRLWFLGFVPLGKQWIVISYPDRERYDRDRYSLRDRGRGDLTTVWDHLITISARPDGRTDYSDEVEIKAGLMTTAIWGFAFVFYRHRQHRWRRLVATADFKAGHKS